MAAMIPMIAKNKPGQPQSKAVAMVMPIAVFLFMIIS
jgi:hypothetical protein